MSRMHMQASRFTAHEYCIFRCYRACAFRMDIWGFISLPR